MPYLQNDQRLSFYTCLSFGALSRVVKVAPAQSSAKVSLENLANGPWGPTSHSFRQPAVQLCFRFAGGKGLEWAKEIVQGQEWFLDSSPQ